jgi:3-oxoadipate enol-lactonase
LLNELGIATAHVLGFSMGGYIAEELAIAHADKVEKLILLATAPYIDGFGRTVVRSLIDVRRSNMSRDQIVRNQGQFLYSPELLDDEDRYERAIQNNLANPYAQQDHAFIRQAQAILGFDAKDRLGAVKNRTLVVAGKDDILVPPRNSDRLAKLIPGAQQKLLSGAHLGCIEYPHEYNEAFIEFLGS